MSVAEMATHNHVANDSGHTHGEQVATAGGAGTGITGTVSLIGNTPANQSTQTGYAGIVVNNNGSSTPFNVVQPSITLAYIIKS